MTLPEAEQVLKFSNFFWPENSVFRMFARGQGRVFGYAIDTPKQLADATDWCDANSFNSYWQINPTQKRDGTKCSSEDVTHWCFLPFDIDPVEKDYDPEAALSLYETELLGMFPSMDDHGTWVDSGRGVQALYSIPAFKLDQPTRYGVSQWMSRLMHDLVARVGLVHGCILDTSCSDLPRVMRMPHTINQKTGRRAQFIMGWDKKYTFTTIPDLPDPDTHERVLQVAEGWDWIDFLPHLTVTARRFIQEGVPSPGRHKAATATMLSMIESGADKTATIDALNLGAALSSPPLHPKDVVDMVNRRFAKQIA